MDGRSHAAGDIAVGYDERKRRGGAEKAQQEDRPQFLPPEAEIASGRDTADSQTQRRHAPAVGQHLERGVPRSQQQEGEQRRQPESRGGESRPENAFRTFHRLAVLRAKVANKFRIGHLPGGEKQAQPQVRRPASPGKTTRTVAYAPKKSPDKRRTYMQSPDDRTRAGTKNGSAGKNRRRPDGQNRLV